MTGSGLIIGGWFAAAVITNLVNEARTILTKRNELHGDVAIMLLKVEASLFQIQKAVEVAECRPVTNRAFTIWMQTINEIASEAEDLLDDFKIKRMQESLQNKVSVFLVHVMDKLCLNDSNGIKKLKDLLERLNTIADQTGSILDIIKINDSDNAMIHKKIQLEFHGREEEQEKLMSVIFPNVPQTEHIAPSIMQDEIRGTANVRVVCIVGKAGVGKTALSQVIYSHPNVTEAFDLRGWVFLPQKFDSNDLFKNIICSFAAEHQTFDSENDLSSIIQNKRFFLVLDNAKDDLQCTWGRLNSELTRGAAGSIVVVTTRSEVNQFIPGSSVITLDTMKTEVLSMILNYHAFGFRRKDSLKSIGEKIAGKLHGLPLLAEVIGRLLSMKLDKDHWQKVSDNKWWSNYEDEAITNPALPSVTITLEFLSSHLKKCLGYCSMFPSSCSLDKTNLAHMWMSNSTQQNDEFVDHASEIKWFDDLFNMSLIQSTVWKNKYTVHEMIKEVVASITQTGCYTVDDLCRPKKNLHGFSHIAIAKRDFNASLGLREHSKVRSVLFFDGQGTTKLNTALLNILPKSSSLRVLDLSCIGSKMGSPPDVISTCSHLRYLDLSFTGITMFPDSICKLYLLEVLGMRGCRFKELPKAMNELGNLRYLYAEACTLSLIHSIGQLTKLQCLEEFSVDDMEGHRITELKDLNSLSGHLCISNLDKVANVKEVTNTELYRKTYIQKLVLKWNEESATPNDCMQTLSQLKPNGHLEDLEIQYYIGVQFPGWIADDFITLRYIKFSDCKKLLELPPLGNLSHLKILILHGLEQIRVIGEEFYGSHDRVFPSLEELTFCDMTNWQKWLEIKSTQTIPHIRKVAIKNCRELSEVPRSVLKGSLEDLEMSRCEKIFSKSPIFLEELKKLRHLKIYSMELATTIYLPGHLLASLRTLKLKNCKVCYQGGQEHVARLGRFLTIDCDEVREKKGRKVTSDAQS